MFKHCQDKEDELEDMEDEEIDRACMDECVVERLEPLPPKVVHTPGMVSLWQCVYISNHLNMWVHKMRGAG